MTVLGFFSPNKSVLIQALRTQSPLCVQTGSGLQHDQNEALNQLLSNPHPKHPLGLLLYFSSPRMQRENATFGTFCARAAALTLKHLPMRHHDNSSQNKWLLIYYLSAGKKTNNTSSRLSTSDLFTTCKARRAALASTGSFFLHAGGGGRGWRPRSS